MSDPLLLVFGQLQYGGESAGEANGVGGVYCRLRAALLLHKGQETAEHLEELIGCVFGTIPVDTGNLEPTPVSRTVQV